MMIRLLFLAISCCALQSLAAQDFQMDRIEQATQPKEAPKHPAAFELPPIGPAQSILKDSVYGYTWNTGSSQWTLTQKYFYTRDCSVGQPTMILGKKFNPATASFEDTVRQTFSYFPDGALKSFLEEYWMPDEQIWQERHFQSYFAPGLLEEKRFRVLDANISNQLTGNRTVYTFNADTLETVEEEFIWNNSTNVWDPDFRYLTDYNPDMTISETKTEYFDGVQGMYLDNGITEYVYDNGSLILTLGYGFIQGQFQQNSMEEYEYDINDNLSSKKSFILYGGSFVPTVKEEFTYDASNNLLEKKTFAYVTLGDDTPTIWGKRIYDRYPSGKLKKESYVIPIEQGMEWLTYSEDSLREDSAYVYRILKYEINQTFDMFTEGTKYLCLYDAIGNPIDVFYFKLQSNTANNWIPIKEILSSYDGNGLLLEQVNKKWLAGAGSFQNTTRQVHFYTACPASLAQGETGGQGIACVHANPMVDGQLVVCPDLVNCEDCMIELFNLSGIKVLNQAVSAGGTRLENLASLPVGVYLLVVRSENGVHYRQKVCVLP